jgi:hypothetical protein
MIEEQGLVLRGPSTGRAWAFRGDAPHDPDWNTRATEEGGRKPALPVVR